MPNLRDGHIGRAQAEAVQHLIDEHDVPITKAIEQVAERMGKPAKTISSAYYRVRNAQQQHERPSARLPLGSTMSETQRLVARVQSALDELDAHLQIRDQRYREALAPLEQFIRQR